MWYVAKAKKGFPKGSLVIVLTLYFDFAQYKLAQDTLIDEFFNSPSFGGVGEALEPDFKIQVLVCNFKFGIHK